MKHRYLSTAVLAAAVGMTACGGAQPAASTTPDDGGSIKIKRATLAFTTADATPFGGTAKKADVFLAITDETGKVLNHGLGVFDGTCQAIAPQTESVLVTMQCWNGGKGVEFGVSTQRNVIIITRLWLQQGVRPDPYAIVELSRVTLELGTKIDAGAL